MAENQKTEDDTFDRLRRLSYAELRDKMDHRSTHMNKVEFIEYLEKEKWHIDEYLGVFYNTLDIGFRERLYTNKENFIKHWHSM